jgi:hypothetical protein
MGKRLNPNLAAVVGREGASVPSPFFILEDLMHWLKLIGFGYLILSCFLTLGFFVILVKEDIRMYREPWERNQSKFGYMLIPNPIGVWGLGWWMLAGTLPVINLFVAAFFLWCRASSRNDQRRQQHE